MARGAVSWWWRHGQEEGVAVMDMRPAAGQGSVVVVVGGGDTNASVRPRLRLRGVLRCCCSAASSVRLWTRASLLLT